MHRYWICCNYLRFSSLCIHFVAFRILSVHECFRVLRTVHPHKIFSLFFSNRFDWSARPQSGTVGIAVWKYYWCTNGYIKHLLHKQVLGVSNIWFVLMHSSLTCICSSQGKVHVWQTWMTRLFHCLSFRSPLPFSLSLCDILVNTNSDLNPNTYDPKYLFTIRGNSPYLVLLDSAHFAAMLLACACAGFSNAYCRPHLHVQECSLF